MKKRLILGGAMALAMLVTNSAYAWVHRDFSLYICNLSKRTIHFKKTYNYQANTNDDYSQDFVVAPNNCSGSINFWGEDRRSGYSLDNRIQWSMIDNNTGENLGEIDYHGATITAAEMRFGIGSAQLSFVDYPKDSVIDDASNKDYQLDAHAVNYLPFSRRTTNWLERVYGNFHAGAEDSFFETASSQYQNSLGHTVPQVSGTIQIIDSIPQSSKTYEDFEFK